ncbi:MAG: 50S ribosomal protein L22 [Gemmatimonadota bacterium]|nr:50S ribosomal protein L22 [Gemmatimonadota bacterium]
MAATPVLTPRARAIQRTTRQSPYKMRLVIDQIRGKNVSDALALLRFSKKHAAKQIEKTLASAVANAEYKARIANEAIDLDMLVISHAVVNEGPSLKRFMPAAQGRATPIRKRTSHVEIYVAERAAKATTVKKTTAKKAAPKKTTAKTAAKKTSRKSEGDK